MGMTKKDYIRPASPRQGLSIPASEGLEATTNTYPKGTPLIVSSGYLQYATSQAVADVIGVSSEDAHTITAGTQKIQFDMALLNIEFIGSVYSATPASAVIAVTDLGGEYGLIYNSTHEIWMVDKDEGTAGHKCLTVTEFIDPVGTLYGRVKFIFNAVGRIVT